METTKPSRMDKLSQPQQEEPHRSQEEADQEELEEVSFPKERGFLFPTIYFYQNFWCPSRPLGFIISSHSRPPFQAQDTDILLATKPKSGTTWLKSLVFTILNRGKYPVMMVGSSNSLSAVNPSNAGGQLHHPLLSAIPHKLVPNLEYTLLNPESISHSGDFSKSPPPRLYSTHLPYHALPDSIKSSGCRIVYLCRNPLDTLVSFWHFSHREGETEEESSRKLEGMVDSFCRGVEGYGPHWINVLGYWKESLERPQKVLFMRFEELKRNEISEIKRLAEFMGTPFTSEEEEKGVIERIAKLCSLGNLKELEVNKGGKVDTRYVENHKYFRKGEVGDWVNHLTPSQAERVNKVMQEKFHGTGLSF